MQEMSMQVIPDDFRARAERLTKLHQPGCEQPRMSLGQQVNLDCDQSRHADTYGSEPRVAGNDSQS